MGFLIYGRIFFFYQGSAEEVKGATDSRDSSLQLLQYKRKNEVFFSSAVMFQFLYPARSTTLTLSTLQEDNLLMKFNSAFNKVTKPSACFIIHTETVGPQ